MRVCQLFSSAVVALTMVTMAGCAAPMASKAVSNTGANSPLVQAMEDAQTQGFSKRAE